MDTVKNPMWDNFRGLLKMLQEQNIKFSRYRIFYGGDKMEVKILSIIPRFFIIDSEGVYISNDKFPIEGL